MVKHTLLALTDKQILGIDIGIVTVLLSGLLQFHSLNFVGSTVMYPFVSSTLLLFFTLTDLPNTNKNGQALAALFRFSAKALTCVGFYWMILFFIPI